MDGENTPIAMLIPGESAKALMEALSDWGNLVTIVIHGGCVFEFKGPFPKGKEGAGFYNLEGSMPGFHGHIHLASIACIGFQEKSHRGRESRAFVFYDSSQETLFKVFLGRGPDQEILPSQLEAYERVKLEMSVKA